MVWDPFYRTDPVGYDWTDPTLAPSHVLNTSHPETRNDMDPLKESIRLLSLELTWKWKTPCW